MNNEKVLIHSDKNKTISGSRFYIHARNVASCILFLINKGIVSEKYNIVGEREVSNIELAKMISSFVGKKLDYEMVDFHSDRPGHDLRYGLDGSKLFDLTALSIAFCNFSKALVSICLTLSLLILYF